MMKASTAIAGAIAGGAGMYFLTRKGGTATGPTTQQISGKITNWGLVLSQTARSVSETLQQSMIQSRAMISEVSARSAETIKQSTQTAKDVMSESVSSAQETMNQTLESTRTAISETLKTTRLSVEDIMENATESAKAVSNSVKESLTNVSEEASDMVEKASEEASDMVEGAQDTVSDIAEKASDTVEGAVDKTKDVAEGLAEYGRTLPNQIGGVLENKIPDMPDTSGWQGEATKIAASATVSAVATGLIMTGIGAPVGIPMLGASVFGGLVGWNL